MKKKYSYTYTMLRYIHDTTTGEFVNVGVAIHAPDAKYSKIICRHTISRLSRLFPGFHADHFKSQMSHIESQFNKLGEILYDELPWKNYDTVFELAKRILPSDDSTLQWSPVGAGTTQDPLATGHKLFDRMVMRYDDKQDHNRKSEEDVWRHFKRNLEDRQLLQLFEPKKIIVKDDEIEFQHTWKNGLLHCLEPVSFDLSSPENIRDKAHKWLGRISSVFDSSEKFRIYFLVGKPQDQKLFKAYESALRILEKVPGNPRIFGEQDVESLSNMINHEVEMHENAFH